MDPVCNPYDGRNKDLTLNGSIGFHISHHLRQCRLERLQGDPEDRLKQFTGEAHMVIAFGGFLHFAD